jgi:hypothetical protein
VPQYFVTRSTAASTSGQTRFRVEPGQITRLGILFPAGCAGLVDARIIRGLAVIWPTNDNGFFRGDGFPIEWNEEYDLPEPTDLILDVRNRDDTLAHEVFIWITVRDARKVAESRGLLAFWDQLRKGFGL